MPDHSQSPNYAGRISLARWIIEWVRWSLWSISSRSSIYGLGLQPWTWPSHWWIVLGQRCIFQRVIINFHLVSPSYRHFPTSQFSPQLLDYSSPSTFFLSEPPYRVPSHSVQSGKAAERRLGQEEVGTHEAPRERLRSDIRRQWRWALLTTRVK